MHSIFDCKLIPELDICMFHLVYDILSLTKATLITKLSFPLLYTRINYTQKSREPLHFLQNEFPYLLNTTVIPFHQRFVANFEFPAKYSDDLFSLLHLQRTAIVIPAFFFYSHQWILLYCWTIINQNFQCNISNSTPCFINRANIVIISLLEQNLMEARTLIIFWYQLCISVYTQEQFWWDWYLASILGSSLELK